jgi:hypothetical protein
MKTKEVTVTARDGSGLKVQAALLLCPGCDMEGPFIVYLVAGEHLHFQCFICEESFCDNSCGDVVA